MINVTVPIPNNARVWVLEPMLSLENIPGVVVGSNVSVGDSEDDIFIRYQIDFGGGFVQWVSCFQIVGFLYGLSAA